MKNIQNKIIKGVFGIAISISLASSLNAQEKNKPFDLSAENANIKELIQSRPNFLLNSDSTTLYGLIPNSESSPNYKGDSSVFKFDKNGDLISRERYFGSDPNQIYFISTIFRNKEGKIDSLISRIGEPPFKPTSNLFPQAEGQFSKELKVFEGESNILVKNIKTYNFRYDSNTKCYYLK